MQSLNKITLHQNFMTISSERTYNNILSSSCDHLINKNDTRRRWWCYQKAHLHGKWHLLYSQKSCIIFIIIVYHLLIAHMIIIIIVKMMVIRILYCLFMNSWFFWEFEIIIVFYWLLFSNICINLTKL